MREIRREPMPQYMTPRGDIRKITGPAAESWPYPRVFEDEDGTRFVEWPMPWETGWGISFQTGYKTSNPVGEFMVQYVEGRSSGFPFWASFAFAAKWAYRKVAHPRKVWEC